MRGLIGGTGFVGSNLISSSAFNKIFNSKTIHNLHKYDFAELICAGAPGSMFLANKDSAKDLKSIEDLIENLKRVKTKRLILISTIGVFKDFAEENDESSNNFEEKIPYGHHRRLLEEELIKSFENIHILRLPSLFGINLKKNLIFDIFNPIPSFLSRERFIKASNSMSNIKMKEFKGLFHFSQDLEMHVLNRQKLNDSSERLYFEHLFNDHEIASIFFYSKESNYQFYDLNDLHKDIDKVIANDLKICHLSSEPISCRRIFSAITNKEMPHTPSKIHSENLISQHASFWKQDGPYIYTSDLILDKLKSFLLKENKR